MNIFKQLTKDDYKNLLEIAENGGGIVINCDIGFMVEIAELGNKRGSIKCPTDGHKIQGEAQAEYVRKALHGWTKRLMDWQRMNP